MYPLFKQSFTKAYGKVTVSVDSSKRGWKVYITTEYNNGQYKGQAANGVTYRNINSANAVAEGIYNQLQVAK